MSKVGREPNRKMVAVPGPGKPEEGMETELISPSAVAARMAGVARYRYTG